jgi:colanic acid/amylovoran biosynthesis glycosyltransferase
MKIAFFVRSFPKVSETFILSQIGGLLDAGHDVTIFATDDPEEETVHNKVNEFDMLERCIYTDPPNSYFGGAICAARCLLKRLSAYKAVSHAVRSDRPDLAIANLEAYIDHDLGSFDAYHAHFGPVGKSWSFISQLSRKANNDAPFIVSYYGYDASTVLEADPDFYVDLFDAVDRITVLSDDMKEKLVSVGGDPEKITYNPLGIDTEFFEFRERTPETPVEILIVSRLVEKKGIVHAVDAVAQLSETVDVSVTIVGDGPERQAIESRIREHAIEDSFSLVGVKSLSEVRDILHESHIFLLPCITDSNGETSPTPTILLQAQATGIPIVSTYHSGIPRIVDDSKSALLVPERDVDALAEAIETLATDPESWSEMGRAGRDYVKQQYSIPALIDRLETIYETA